MSGHLFAAYYLLGAMMIIDRKSYEQMTFIELFVFAIRVSVSLGGGVLTYQTAGLVPAIPVAIVIFFLFPLLHWEQFFCCLSLERRGGKNRFARMGSVRTLTINGSELETECWYANANAASILSGKGIRLRLSMTKAG
jgi:hypothetical protein